MTAIYSALRLIQKHYLSTLQQVGDTTTTTAPSMAAKGLESTDVVVFGFPYLDTLKVSSLYSSILYLSHVFMLVYN